MRRTPFIAASTAAVLALGGAIAVASGDDTADQTVTITVTAGARTLTIEPVDPEGESVDLAFSATVGTELELFDDSTQLRVSNPLGPADVLVTRSGPGGAAAPDLVGIELDLDPNGDANAGLNGNPTWEGTDGGQRVVKGDAKAEEFTLTLGWDILGTPTAAGTITSVFTFTITDAAPASED